MSAIAFYEKVIKVKADVAAYLSYRLEIASRMCVEPEIPLALARDKARPPLLGQHDAETLKFEAGFLGDQVVESFFDFSLERH